MLSDTYSYHRCYAWMSVAIEFVDMTKTYSKVHSQSTQITKEAFDSGILTAKHMYGCRIDPKDLRTSEPS